MDTLHVNEMLGISVSLQGDQKRSVERERISFTYKGKEFMHDNKMNVSYEFEADDPTETLKCIVLFFFGKKCTKVGVCVGDEENNTITQFVRGDYRVVTIHRGDAGRIEVKMS